MSQIKITILKEVQQPNVIACSFFTMTDSYRAFGKYKIHLEVFLKYTKKLTDFEVRIYTDDTGSEFALEVSKDYPNVSVHHFDCPEFREGTGHVGTFGTLARFLPLFEDHKVVWISDIDIPEHWINELSGVDFEGYSYLCYDRKVYARKYTLVAGRFITRVKLPRALLTRFITKVAKGDYKSTIQALNESNKRKPSSEFPYGMDEVFINSSVYDWIKKGSFSVRVILDYNPSILISFSADLTQEEKYLLDKFYKTGHKSLFTKIKDIFRKKVTPILDKQPCLRPLINELDSFKNNFYKTIQLKSSDL